MSIEYGDVGAGRPIVFVHGAYVTGSLWDDVVRRLSEHYRCITPTWLFGAQRRSCGDADLGVPASGRRIGAFLAELNLEDVTLVSNDTGGGIVLSAFADPLARFGRISQLVFANCDTFEYFPPPNFAPLVRLCRLSATAAAIALRLLATTRGLRMFGSMVTHRGIDQSRWPAIFGGFACSGQVRREAVQFSVGLDSRFTMAAETALAQWTKPVLVAWGERDEVLTVSRARQLAAAFPNARLITIADASTFVMLDNPERLAAHISDFVG